jgi:uncharacterized protein YkwD
MSRKVNTARGLVAGAIALLLVACASSGGGARTAPRIPVEGKYAGWSSEEDNRLELRTFLLANRARRESGLPALELRYDLVRLARKHAEDMARRDYFSHYNPDGEGPGDRARGNRVEFTAFAENLARIKYANDPARLAVEGWLESPGHRRNLLDETAAEYRYTGVGAACREDGTILLAQVFLK